MTFIMKFFLAIGLVVKKIYVAFKNSNVKLEVSIRVRERESKISRKNLANKSHRMHAYYCIAKY